MSTKQAICAYVACQALPFMKRGIRINAICPGPTDTPLAQANKEMWLGFGADYRDEVGVDASSPLEQAYTLVFLCSEAAAGDQRGHAHHRHGLLRGRRDRDLPGRHARRPIPARPPVTPMSAPDLTRIGVVGCGLMGSGIAEVAARAGLDVVVLEADDASVQVGLDRLGTSLGQAVRRGKLSEEDRDATLERIQVTPDRDALADRQLVVEAVPEFEALKLDTFRMLDEVVTQPDAVLASNTSSIPIMKLAMATQRPEQVIGIHFFNPVPVLPLVELVPSLLTSPAVVEQSTSFASGQLAKHVIESQDRAGFVVNALLIPYLLSAIRMLESGFATAEHIDEGMVRGCAHPMGPLALARTSSASTPSWPWPCRCTRSSRSRSTPRRRCSRGWSMPVCSVASRAAASTSTPEPRPARQRSCHSTR